MTNEEIIDAVLRWQADPYYAPMTCGFGPHGKLAPVELDGQVVLICPGCDHRERVIPEAVLKASRGGRTPIE
jgi:hypothetical protein